MLKVSVRESVCIVVVYVKQILEIIIKLFTYIKFLMILYILFFFFLYLVFINSIFLTKFMDILELLYLIKYFYFTAYIYS